MQRKPLGAINITPLVDVLLILLVIVMLAMPAFVKKLPVSLPKTGITSEAVTANNLQIGLTSEGQVLFNNTPVRLSDILTHIQPTTIIELSVDEKTPYGRAAQLIAALQDKNPQEIVLATQ